MPTTKKKFEPDPNSALAQLSQLPKVGGGLGGYDISLGFSHRYALEIALDTLSELKEDEKNQALDGIYTVFEQWKNEHGIYPPNLGGMLFALGGGSKEPEPAREYIKRQNLAAELSGEKPKYIKPWECDSFARTPVRLFFKLLSEDYPPLRAYIGKSKPAQYDFILATVIIMSHNSDSEYQSSDCIEGAFKLAQIRLDIQKSLIEGMKPLAQETYNKRRQAKIGRNAEKEETERKILEQNKIYENAQVFPCLYTFSDDLKKLHSEKPRGFSQANISRILKKNGIHRYK